MKKLIFVLVPGMILSCCSTNDTYPDIPALEFKALNFSVGSSDKTYRLTATFTDGDGDVGYYQDKPNGAAYDSIYSPYYYNFVAAMQIFRNGTWKDTVIISDIDDKNDTILANDDTLFYNESISSRLPYLTQSGQNKGLKGDIDITNFLPYLAGDTIRFVAFIYDRAFHKSNEITTPGYFIHNP